MTIRKRLRRGSCSKAVLLLLSFVLLQRASEMRAFASCGDWLAHPTSHSAVDRTAGETTDSALTSSENQHPIRCDGPFCHDAPARPVPTAPLSTVNPSDKLLLVAQGIIFVTPDRWSFAGSDTSAHELRGFPVDIDHPPRA
jgi:hypothetical protein